MKTAVKIALVLLVALGFLATASAETVTVEGTVVCAKCALKKADAKQCQNVLVAPGKDGNDVEYYMAKSEAADKLGEVCMAKKKVIVTGEVTEKEGRKWITASKVETQG